MLLKDPKYDEFLAQQIQAGLEDAAKGNCLTAEQFKQEMELLLMRKEQELQQFEGNIAYA